MPGKVFLKLHWKQSEVEKAAMAKAEAEQINAQIRERLAARAAAHPEEEEEEEPVRRLRFFGGNIKGSGNINRRGQGKAWGVSSKELKAINARIAAKASEVKSGVARRMSNAGGLGKSGAEKTSGTGSGRRGSVVASAVSSAGGVVARSLRRL